jgi:hypothetical protein
VTLSAKLALLAVKWGQKKTLGAGPGVFAFWRLIRDCKAGYWAQVDALRITSIIKVAHPR